MDSHGKAPRYRAVQLHPHSSQQEQMTHREEWNHCVQKVIQGLEALKMLRKEEPLVPK